MNLLETWVIHALAIWATAALLPGIQLRGAANAMVVAAILGILDTCLSWFLFVLFGVATLGIGFLLASITHWAVLGVLLMFTARLTPRIRVASFGWAFLGAVLMTFIGSVAERLLLGGSAYRF